MFKYALLAAATFFSLNAFAGGSISVNPTAPIVFTSDIQQGGVLIQGPWFVSTYQMQVDEPSELTGLLIEVTSIEGNQVTYELTFDQPVEMNAGDAIATPALYIDNLPQSASTQYSVRVDVEGSTSSGDALGLTTAFVTQ
jgi:hypothetical protein